MDINMDQVVIGLAAIILLKDWVAELFSTDWSARNNENMYKRDIFK